jgi:hypothetical protein
MSFPHMRAGVSVLVASALMVACGDGTGPAGSAAATVTLSSSATDGAILLRVTGPGFDDAPEAVSQGQRLYSRQISDSELVVAEFGPIANGPLFTVRIPNGSRMGSYSVTVIQVSDPTNELRDDLSKYQVAITLAPDSQN